MRINDDDLAFGMMLQLMREVGFDEDQIEILNNDNGKNRMLLLQDLYPQTLFTYGLLFGPTEEVGVWGWYVDSTRIKMLGKANYAEIALLQSWVYLKGFTISEMTDKISARQRVGLG